MEANSRGRSLSFRLIGAAIALLFAAVLMGWGGMSALATAQSGIVEATQPAVTPPILLGSGQPYLGVGSPLAVERSGDPTMQMQAHWLSINLPGTDKDFGDPFTSKWDYLIGGHYPVGGDFQPSHDLSGYNYGLYVPDGASGGLQIYDAAYQPKMRSDSYYYTQVMGNISNRWCADNEAETGDNQPAAPMQGNPALYITQCSWQAADANTIYSLYYPDGTPYYYGDDVLADQWIVPPSPITGTDPISGFVHSYVYSNTWTNFMDAPNPYLLTPQNGNHQWRLNVNAPLDLDHHAQGVVAQNNFGLRLMTSDTGLLVYAMQRMGAVSNLSSTMGSNQASYAIANIPAEEAGHKIVVNLFDPGDFNGSNHIELLAPDNNSVTFHVVTHGNHDPAEFDTSLLDTTRNSANTNYDNEWLDLLYTLPQGYQGGYWKLRYSYGPGGGNDRITWRVHVECANPFVDVGGNLFYSAIHELNCESIATGIDSQHFNPRGTATRAQFARMVIRGFGMMLTTPTQPSFSDVPPSFFAYSYIESGKAAGILGGYDAATCAASHATYPCYLPNNAITRAEIARLVVKAANYARYTPTTPTFSDVPPNNFAYSYIETAYARGLIRGVDPTHFQPNRAVRRDEMCQMVYKAINAP